jgi:ferredoxin
MTHIITALCLRDSACVTVCPVECIIPGKPEAEWPWYYIDPDTCIDCGACVPECPFEAIFPEDEVPSDYTVAKEGVQISRGDGEEVYEGHDDKGDAVTVEKVRTLPVGEVVDLKPDIQPNYDYFKTGPGYKAIGK